MIARLDIKESSIKCYNIEETMDMEILQAIEEEVE